MKKGTGRGDSQYLLIAIARLQCFYLLYKRIAVKNNFVKVIDENAMMMIKKSDSVSRNYIE